MVDSEVVEEFERCRVSARQRRFDLLRLIDRDCCGSLVIP